VRICVLQVHTVNPRRVATDRGIVGRYKRLAFIWVKVLTTDHCQELANWIFVETIDN